MTTAADKRRRPRRRSEAGQSIIEFAFLMPIIFTMTSTLLNLNMAINASIVNTRYARATMMYLFFNHRWYPENSYVQMNGDQNMQRWWTGVGFTQVSATNQHPVAPTIKVGKAPTSQDQTAGSEGITARQQVRIRATAFTCLPPRGPKGSTPFSLGGMSETAFSTGTAQGNYCNTQF